MAGELDGERETSRAPYRQLRQNLSLVTAVVAVLLLAAGGAAAAFRLSRPAKASDPKTGSRADGCQQAASGLPNKTPSSLGSWRYQPTLAGTFLSFVPGPRGLLDALQACGAEESSLRLIELSRAGQLEEASRHFKKAAPLASSAVWSGRHLYLGTGTLALSKTTARVPYRLELYELNARLQVVKQLPLGRGDGLVLVPGPQGSVVASTGTSFVRILPDGEKVPLGYSSNAVTQHVVSMTSTTALVSTFRPSAQSPSSSTTLFVLNLRTGAVSSAKHLAGEEEIESLAWNGRKALAVLSSGSTESLEETTSLQPLALSSIRNETALSSISLLASSSHLLVSSLNALSCLSSSGAVVASTRPRGSAEVPSGLGEEDRVSFAITPSGIGKLLLPAAC